MFQLQFNSFNILFKVQNDVILIVQKWDNCLWPTYFASWIFVITVMHIIGYELDTEMNIVLKETIYLMDWIVTETHRFITIKKYVCLGSWFMVVAKLSRSVATLYAPCMTHITRKPMLAYNADVRIHTSLKSHNFFETNAFILRTLKQICWVDAKNNVH